MDEPFVKALKEEYIRYGGRIPYKMIIHFWTKFSKVTNRDKLQLKKEVLIAWKQPQIFLAYFKQIKKAKKQLAKWKVSVSDNDIITHVVEQMYESDWFSEETMTKWEETNDNIKNMAKLPEVQIWQHSYGNETSRLVQGMQVRV